MKKLFGILSFFVALTCASMVAAFFMVPDASMSNEGALVGWILAAAGWLIHHIYFIDWRRSDEDEAMKIVREARAEMEKQA